MTQSAPVRFNVVKPLSLAVSSVLLAACSSTPPAGQSTVANATTYRMPTTSTKTIYTHNTPSNPNALLDNSSLDELEGLLEATDMKMVENNALLVQRYGNLWDRLRASFKMDESHYDPRIEAQKSWFISRQDYLNRLTARASRYLYHTVREAERRNIPAELALLPVIESSYDPLANSNAAAVGLWQFIPSTGRIYGLNQTPTFDGRRDVIESTRAAYDFLTTLYNQFGSWELALAAYNAGPGRIQSAIDYNAARGLPTDYWSLRLPTETMNYVPRFLAVAQIVKNPASYNVYLPAIANRQHFRSVPANVGVSLSEISGLTGVEYNELRALNPGLIAGAVDISGPNRILIPNEVNSAVDKRISGLRGNGFSSSPAYSASTNYPAVTTTTPTYTPSGITTGTTTLNSAGDNLLAAQQAYNKTAKGLPSSSSELANYATSMVKNQTTAYVTPSRTSSANEPPISASEQKQIAQQMQTENTLPTTFAQVTPNNTIVQEPPLTKSEQAVIATQIQQTSPQISQVISPVDGKIKVTAIQTQQSILDAKGETKQLSYDGGMGVPTATGQATAAPLEGSFSTTPNTSTTDQPPAKTAARTPPTAAVKTKPRPKGTRSIYQVKKGDTLKSLAARMGVNWRDVAEWNQIDPNANLLVGTTLYLYNAKPVASEPSTTDNNDDSDDTPDNYVVQSGDTLSGIANKYDLDLAELASYNNIPTSYAVRTKQTLWLIPGKVKSVPKTLPKPAQAVTPKVIPVKKPVPKIATSNYKVQSGDGLIALADEYDISVSQLAALNDLDPSDSLQVGQALKVPAATTTKTASKANTKLTKPKIAIEKADKKAVTKVATKAAKPVSYKVKSGDSLTSLANRYHVTPQALAKSNGMPANANLIIGQTVKIPEDDE